MGLLNVFVTDKEKTSLEIAEPHPIKAKDQFLQIRKKIYPMVNIEIEGKLPYPLLVPKKKRP